MKGSNDAAYNTDEKDNVSRPYLTVQHTIKTWKLGKQTK